MPRRSNNGLPDYCTRSVDRHGKTRIRFRKRGFSTYLTGIPWSENFMEEYAAALEGLEFQKQEIGSSKTKPGTFNSLVVYYYKSADFQRLADSSKSTRRGIIERFRVNHGDKHLNSLQRQHIRAIIGSMEDRPQAANNLLSVLKLLLDLALDMGMVTGNVARGVKGYAKETKGFHSWTDSEIEQYRDRHVEGTQAHLALMLLLHTAQRRGDVVRMGWQHIRGDMLAVTQQKTGTSLEIPLHPELSHALRLVGRSNLTFLTTSKGAPFTAAGFGNWFRDRCNEASLFGCAAHGLRKAAATRLAEAGASTELIKSITGHKTSKEVDRYTRAADQKRLARQAVELLVSSEREQVLSNHKRKLDNK